jgi:hypothetical protein
MYLSLEGTFLNEKHNRLLELLLGHCASVQSPFRMREALYTLEVKDCTPSPPNSELARLQGDNFVFLDCPLVIFFSISVIVSIMD